MSNVSEPDDRLSGYLDDELVAPERAEVERLLAESQEWRDALAEVAWARDAVRGLPVLDPPARVERRARTARVGRALAVAAAIVAAVTVFALPLEKTEEGKDRRTTVRNERTDQTAVTAPRGAIATEDDDGVLEDVVDALREPFDW